MSKMIKFAALFIALAIGQATVVPCNADDDNNSQQERRRDERQRRKRSPSPSPKASPKPTATPTPKPTATPTPKPTTTPTPTATPPAGGCTTCHGIPPATGHHSKHSGYACSTCHGTGYSSTTVNASTHQNGVKNIVTTIGWKSGSCTPSCHGTKSW